MRKLLIAVFLVATVAIASSCGGPVEKDYGAAITVESATPIGEVLANAKDLQDKTVKVQGTIIEECPAGGWFMLKDDSGVVYVNLHPSYFAIPQAVGKKAIAQGVVKKEGTRIEIVGKGVQLP